MSTKTNTKARNAKMPTHALYHVTDTKEDKSNWIAHLGGPRWAGRTAAEPFHLDLLPVDGRIAMRVIDLGARRPEVIPYLPRPPAFRRGTGFPPVSVSFFLPNRGPGSSRSAREFSGSSRRRSDAAFLVLSTSAVRRVHPASRLRQATIRCVACPLNRSSTLPDDG